MRGTADNASRRCLYPVLEVFAPVSDTTSDLWSTIRARLEGRASSCEGKAFHATITHASCRTALVHLAGFGLRWGSIGIVVTLVDPDWTDIGLRRGDLIVQVNQKDV